MNTNLEPCRFCGHAPHVEIEDGTPWCVWCVQCGIKGCVNSVTMHAGDVVKVWNERATKEVRP